MSEDYERSSYEIQLDHKQLILIFFTAVGVLVIMFLLGMMVGQGKGFGPLKTVGFSGKPMASVAGNLPADAPDTRQDEGSVADDVVAAKPRNKKPAHDNPVRSSEKAKPADQPVPAKAVEMVQTPKHDVDPASFPLSFETGFAVQVMTFKDNERASVLRQSLKDKGYPAYVDVRNATGGTRYYRIRIGKFLNQQDALLVKDKLRLEEGFKDMIVVR